MTRLASLLARTSLAAIGLASLAAPAAADEIGMLVPSAIVYPGQAIEGRPLQPRDFRVNPNLVAEYVLDASQVAGKVARRTLLPGKPIRLSDLKGADVVSAGTPVTLVYREGGMVITGLGTSLQSAGEGETIRAKNVDSGLIVSGIARADGSVEIGG